MSSLRWVGMDVHGETITLAVAEANGEVRALGTIPNRPESLRRVMTRLGPPEQLRACYEAGPTGYGVYWQLAGWGIPCTVVAPSLVPVKAGDRVKTDRRDALKLARNFRAGDLTPVWVPDQAQEALRDLVRAREAATRDHLRARHRLSKLLLRHSRRPPRDVRAWTARYWRWVRQEVQFSEPAQAATLADLVAEVEHQAERIRRLETAIREAVAQLPPARRAVVDALQALRGIALITAVTVQVEVGWVTRFGSARQLMGYVGLVPSEASSGGRTRRGGITKTGNAHLRRVVTEAAWAYRHRPHIGAALRQRQAGVSAPICAIAWKAQHRLYRKYGRLIARGKCRQRAVAAVARELVGFIWAIGRAAEAAEDTRQVA